MNRSGGDIDELLRQFYRRERPDPWPAAPAVGSVGVRESGVSRPVAAPGGRWALAASLGLFALLGVVLARQMPAPVAGPGLPVDEGKAALPKALRGR
jgi:hypothetical protein